MPTQAIHSGVISRLNQSSASQQLLMLLCPAAGESRCKLLNLHVPDRFPHADERSLRLSSPGDKVEFQVTEAPDALPSLKSFRNLTLESLCSTD